MRRTEGGVLVYLRGVLVYLRGGLVYLRGDWSIVGRDWTLRPMIAGNFLFRSCFSASKNSSTSRNILTAITATNTADIIEDNVESQTCWLAIEALALDLLDFLSEAASRLLFLIILPYQGARRLIV